MRHAKSIATFTGCLGLWLLCWTGLSSAEMPASETDRMVPNVAVRDQDGRTFQFYRDLVQGRTVLISFVFTACQASCPTQTAILRDVRQRWRTDSDVQGDVLLISMTVDPKHDGPQQLKDYAQRFGVDAGIDRGWVFLTAEPSAHRQLLAAFAGQVVRPADHTSVLWVGNEPQGRWTRTAALNSPQQLVKLLQEMSR